MSKTNVSRQGRNTKSPRTTILIFTEGEVSEPKYIKKLGPYKGNVDVKLSDKHGIGTLEHFIKDCDQSFKIDYNKNEKAKISTIWLVFDFDDRLDAHKYLRKIEKGQVLVCDGDVRDFGYKKVECSFTSMCIEYWILLHFTNHNGKTIYRTTDKHKSTKLIHLINEEIKSFNAKYNKSIPEYGKTDDWLEKVWSEFEAINPDNPLRFISPKPRIVEAYARAKQIAKSKTPGNEYDESVTYFFKLLEAMDIIIDKWVYKDKDGVIHEDVQKKGKGFIYKSGIKTFQIPQDEIFKVRLEPFLKKSR